MDRLSSMPVTRVAAKAVFILFGVVLLIRNDTVAQQIIHVDIQATGINNGSSWSDAYDNLQDALATAQSGDEIWVAEGVYLADHGDGITLGDRTVSFLVSNAFDVYGGFNGSENSLDQRDVELNETILSGDLLGNDIPNIELLGPDKSDNSLHVVRVAAPLSENAARLDGFTITGGSASENGSKNGGGLVIEPASHVLIYHMTFVNNAACTYGGAIYSQGTFLLKHSRLVRNSTGPDAQFPCRGGWGGAIYQRPVHPAGQKVPIPMIEDVHFESNYARNGGGAIAAWDHPLNVIESIFVNNYTTFEGGAIYTHIIRTRSHFINVRFIGNYVQSDKGLGGALSIGGSDAVVTNALFNGNYVYDSDGANGYGGAIAVYRSESKVWVTSSTIVNNQARHGSAIYKGLPEIFKVLNSVIWDNLSQDDTVFLIPEERPIPIGFSIIQDGPQPTVEDLGGNIYTSAEFIDPPGDDGILGTIDDNFGLMSSSPGIDDGDNQALPRDIFDLNENGDFEERLPFDIRGEPRIVSNNGMEAVTDIGAYEYNIFVDNISGSSTSTSNVAERCTGLSVYPNPVVNSANINIESTTFSSLIATVFDTTGRLVSTVELGIEPGGLAAYSISVSALAPGPYLLKVSDRFTGWSCSKLLVKLSN